MMKKIPYGMSDFKEIKINNYYYIDKTNFIEKIEDNSNFLFFLRPRRFGKSLLISTLESYYDKNYKDEFDELFKDTYIINNLTSLKSSFHIMKFDFSAVDITDYINSFQNHILSVIDRFLDSYSLDIKFISDNPISRLDQLFMYCSSKRISIYVLIDEYDNFVNKILIDDMNVYKDLVTTREAFYKQFFTILKVGTSGTDAPIKKMFFTGVSPLALFDVTSGSNIGSNISMDDIFNDMVGITKSEVKELINYYGFDKQRDKIIDRFNEWYDNYRFSEGVEYTIYNTDMVLYYLKSLIYDDEEPNDSSFVQSNGCQYYEPIEIPKMLDHKNKLLSMFCLNTQGLKSHWDAFRNLIYDMGAGIHLFDIIGITELFHVSNGDCPLEGYHPLEFKIRKDSHNSRGGVGIYIKDTISYETRPDLSVFVPNVFEAVFIEIKI